jgi:division protein CdvB (Snf7/Vps24/ESCRT-III family)
MRFPFGRQELLGPNDARFTEIMMALRLQADKLSRTAARLSARGKELFEQCVRAQQEGDVSRATVYANEIAQLRKMTRVVMRSQLSLEKVILRLETVKEFGDVMHVLGPAAAIIRQVQSDLSGVVPEVSQNLKYVDEVLENLIAEVGSVTGTTTTVTVSDPEAQKILQEAAEIAAQRMKTVFPDVPEAFKSPSSEASRNV